MYTLNQVVPIPLKDQISASQIWSTSCTFQKGKRYFVHAPSGSGKTTLQHLLYGLRDDYEGDIALEMKGGGKRVIKGLDLNQWTTIRQEQVSVIFQDLRLFLEFSALENIQIKNRLTNHKTEEEILAMAERLGVKELLGKHCGKLSYGQRQRIAIIRALCQPFGLLLMDEPFSHLDKDNIQRCCDLIMEECKSQEAGYVIASLGDKYVLEYDEEVRL
ncbi:MAG: ATP-binding cassette domain-containing protein [Aureispira sp.]|nr:ATP-binding cassette domain-containing protein [Aureispira sp.]